MRKLVIASHNRAKAGEMVQILGARFPELDILTLADFEGAPEPEETGSTYAENASIKSESALKFTGEWCIADDAGLEIDALDGAPGLRSKRFEGVGTTFAHKIAKVIELLADVPEEKRSARFRCCIAFSRPGEETKVMESTCEGFITHAPSGAGGFGYDPIFFVPELGCTMADVTAEQKHAISHRGKVLKAFGDYLAEILK